MTAKPPLALAFPLRGSQLIEASAGTGKTFTISALYLRLVLGHGGEASGFGRELLPPQILVVTFTDAATKELRERIRTRLAEAARFFRDETLSAGCPDRRVARASTRPSSGPAAPTVWTSPRNGWTKRLSRPSTAGASACCASTRSTAAACSPRRWKPITAICWAKSCATTGDCSATRMQGDALNWVRGNWGGPAALLPRVRALFGRASATALKVNNPPQLIAECLQERTGRPARTQDALGVSGPTSCLPSVIEACREQSGRRPQDAGALLRTLVRQAERLGRRRTTSSNSTSAPASPA